MLTILAAAVEPEPAPPPAAASLILAARHDRLETDDLRGETLELTWLQAPRPRRWLAGASASRLGDGRWAFGTLGLVRSAGTTVWNGDLKWGRGRRDGESFDYRQIALAWTRVMAGGAAALTVESRYLDIDRSRGNLVRTALRLAPHARLTGELAFQRSTGGNLGTEIVSLRLDFVPAPRFALIAGAADGHTRPEVVGIIASDPDTAAGDGYRLAFAGLSFPIRRLGATLLFERQRIAGSRRAAISLVLRAPLGPRS